MKEIKLTQGQVALVDDEDYEYLNQWKWCANRSIGGYYAVRTDKQKADQKRETICMHRLILNAPKGLQVDHINHNTLDNTKQNLRICTNSQNQMNRSPCGKSKYLGVTYYRNNTCLRASIKANNKSIHLGYFKTEEEAAHAYDEAAKKYFGEFANLNFKQ